MRPVLFQKISKDFGLKQKKRKKDWYTRKKKE